MYSCLPNIKSSAALGCEAYELLPVARSMFQDDEASVDLAKASEA